MIAVLAAAISFAILSMRTGGVQWSPTFSVEMDSGCITNVDESLRIDAIDRDAGKVWITVDSGVNNENVCLIGVYGEHTVPADLIRSAVLKEQGEWDAGTITLLVSTRAVGMAIYDLDLERGLVREKR
ncbi:MAG: hypothetical protein NUV56_00690 [Candidatus Uhrbacteria bacterium]|nr:hypothetical protein [Candidatus Uhrbacteria bacterium]